MQIGIIDGQGICYLLFHGHFDGRNDSRKGAANDYAQSHKSGAANEIPGMGYAVGGGCFVNIFFVAGADENAISQNVFLSYGLPGFVSGMFMSALNLAQLLSSFECSTVLFPRKILLPKILIAIYTLQAKELEHVQVVSCKIENEIVGS